jgi:hypothetical protein
LPPGNLTIYVLEGQGEAHDVKQRVTATLVVEVRDENGQPVDGAKVLFELPAVGPGGSFPGQIFTATATTNSQGQAAVTFTPNMEAGRYNIKVSATFGNRMGRATIRQSNGARALKSSADTKSGIFKFAWWKVAVLAGAGAGIGIALATRGSSGSSVTLIPGTPTFGAP